MELMKDGISGVMLDSLLVSHRMEVRLCSRYLTSLGKWGIQMKASGCLNFVRVSRPTSSALAPFHSILVYTVICTYTYTCHQRDDAAPHGVKLLDHRGHSSLASITRDGHAAS
jgi:hypothetical protein